MRGASQSSGGGGARVALSFLLLAAMAVSAQIVPSTVPNHSAAKPPAVTYLFPQQAKVAAGKPADLALHFQVARGLHINSHTPSDPALIPATFSIPEGMGVRLDTATYPAGSIISLALDPGTRLSVYTGEFTIHARIVAERGDHLVQGKLRYQACDRNECLPPKTIDVPIDVIGE